MTTTMATSKPLVHNSNLQKNVIYTIKKKTSIGPYCEIELDDVKIRVPVYVNSFQKDFVRYNGRGEIEFLHPRHMYCFCHNNCKCGCAEIPGCLCTCIFKDKDITIYNFDNFFQKIDKLLDDPNIWCQGCLNYTWDWDLNHIECGLE